MVSPSEERYLEEIYYHVLEHGYARISYIAKSLNVAVPSASKMAGRLSRQGLLDYEPYGMIHLTKKGFAIGRELERNHKVLENFFRLIQLKEELIEQEVKNIEHHISSEAVGKIKDFMSTHFPE
ncbi:metal-dependent transcriptional regulator [Metabacillus iocasae]|uniref:Manganese transport regulator n=1 Tax=Priestia iocasae TaxID=2291674 RepID=A0ABS2QY26_9BACI|nr:metal-dependent transcriptional regulator [Metabacillus iocasae]MBM7704370.1 Mn-dependent DtxR family transcriptional regulator [Metabacillus iocasae]